MKNKVESFVYLNTQNHISLSSLITLYWCMLIIPFILLVMSVVGKNFFPIISIGLWSIIYWALIFILKCKRVKKTFELRFLVNGIFGVLLSLVFWILLTSFVLVSDKPILSLGICYLILPCYLLCSLIYVLILVLFVHKGFYVKNEYKRRKSLINRISYTFCMIVPCCGILGICTSRLAREAFSDGAQVVIFSILLILLIFIPILSHINFLQFFYCKKYKIYCDENGDTTTPDLI